MFIYVCFYFVLTRTLYAKWLQHLILSCFEIEKLRFISYRNLESGSTTAEANSHPDGCFVRGSWWRRNKEICNCL